MPKAITVSSIFKAVDYQPHPTQIRIHSAKPNHRFRVVDAGRRTGKSQAGGHELSVEAFRARTMLKDLDPQGRRHEYWIVGPEYSDAEKEFRVLWRDIRSLGLEMDHPGSYNDPIGGNLHMSLFGGRFQVHGKSAKYPDTLVGEGLEGVILAEAAKLKPSVWTKYVRPMLSDYRGWALFSSTPEGKNWFYEAWQRGIDPLDLNWWSIKMPSWSNPFLYPEGRLDSEIIDLLKDLGPEKFKQEIGAEFTDFVGAVFKDFDEEIHVGRYPYNPRWPLYIATDYGFTNPNVALFIQVDIWDNITIVGEYYERGRTADEFATEVMADPYLGAILPKARMIYPDPEDPGATATLVKNWRVPSAGSTGGLLEDRLNLIRKWLRPVNGYLGAATDEPPKLGIDLSCKNTIFEFGEYRYPENKSEVRNDTEKPIKKNDHSPEAFGRFMAGYYEKVKDKNTARQRIARVAG